MEFLIQGSIVNCQVNYEFLFHRKALLLPAKHWIYYSCTCFIVGAKPRKSIPIAKTTSPTTPVLTLFFKNVTIRWCYPFRWMDEGYPSKMTSGGSKISRRGHQPHRGDPLPIRLRLIKFVCQKEEEWEPEQGCAGFAPSGSANEVGPQVYLHDVGACR